MTDPVEKLELKYEGKAKKVFSTANPQRYVVAYKDDATAYNAQKRGTISGKAIVNNGVSSEVYRWLMEQGIATHFIEQLSENEQLVKAVEIIPVEVIIRNKAAGSFAKRYGVEEGLPLNPIVIEWCYKRDDLGDPPLNDATVVALGLASAEDLQTLLTMATLINDKLKPYFKARSLELIDFKLEFGRLPDGEIILADEISPDTCRLWDSETHEKLDKDRFRRDLGDVEQAYQEVYKRVVGEKYA